MNHCPAQVFDHHYHFDHLLDTAYEVEEGHALVGGHSPEEASPISSTGDLTDLGGQQQWSDPGVT